MLFWRASPRWLPRAKAILCLQTSIHDLELLAEKSVSVQCGMMVRRVEVGDSGCKRGEVR